MEPQTEMTSAHGNDQAKLPAENLRSLMATRQYWLIALTPLFIMIINMVVWFLIFMGGKYPSPFWYILILLVVFGCSTSFAVNFYRPFATNVRRAIYLDVPLAILSIIMTLIIALLIGIEGIYLYWLVYLPNIIGYLLILNVSLVFFSLLGAKARIARERKALSKTVAVPGSVPWRLLLVLGGIVFIFGLMIVEQTMQPISIAHLQFQRAIGRDYFPNMNLENANLQGIDLHGINLSESNLRGVDFSGADLGVSKLIGCDLTGANLRGTILKGANLNNANLRGVDLSGADLAGAGLTNADLTDAILIGADLTWTSLFETILIGANLSGADLIDVNLYHADLTGAILTGADLSGQRLTNANLTGANLTEANLTQARLLNTNLSGANLTGADLTGADLSAANLSNADLTGAILTDVILPEDWSAPLP